MYLNLLYPVYSLIHLFPDNSTWHPVHPHRNNHTLNPSTCFLDTLYFLFNSEIASVAETFLVKTFLTLWRHSASNGMLSILKLDSILLTLLSTVIRVSFPLSPFPFTERYLFFYSIPQNATSILQISVLWRANIVCKLITKHVRALVNQAFPPLPSSYFSSTTWKM